MEQLERRESGVPAPYRADGYGPAYGYDQGGGPALRREVGEYLEILRRHWWLVLAACVVSVGTVWWTQSDRISTYTAEVLMQQRHEVGVVNTRLMNNDEFASQTELIRSRSVIAPVVDSLGLRLVLLERPDRWSAVVGDLEVGPESSLGAYSLRLEGDSLVLAEMDSERRLGDFPPGEPIGTEDFQLTLADPSVVDAEPVRFAITSAESAIQSHQRKVTVEPGKGPDLVRLLYTDPDRQRAAAVVNAVSRSYQDYRANAAREAAARRRGVIGNQLVELADSLGAVRNELLDYQQREEMLSAGAEEGALFSARLETENELRQYRFQRGLLQSLLANLRSADQGSAALDDLMTRAAEVVPSGRALYQRLQNLEEERSRLTASRFGFTSKEPRVQVLDSLITSTRQQMRVAAEQSLELLEDRLAEAQSRLGELRYEVGALPERSAELARYEQRVDAVQEVFDMLVGKYYEAQIAEGIEVGDVEVVDPAAVPLAPDPSHTGLYLFIALLVGLVVGGAGAVTVDRLDPKVRMTGDAERATHLEVLGQIPHLRTTQNGSESAALGKEALRALRTTLRFARSEQLQTVAITSAEPREGKTTTAANLALSFLEQGKKTLLIDGDLRRPVLHETLGVPVAPGLTDLLDGRVELDAVIKRSHFGGLHLIPAGRPAPNAPELIGSDGFLKLIDALREDWDLIVIDTPPVLAVSDVSVIARAMDGVLFVARANRTNQDGLEEAVRRLRRVNAPLIGLVLNAVGRDKVSYGQYYYYYGDGAGKKRKARPERPRARALLSGAGSEPEGNG